MFWDKIYADFFTEKFFLYFLFLVVLIQVIYTTQSLCLVYKKSLNSVNSQSNCNKTNIVSNMVTYLFNLVYWVQLIYKIQHLNRHVAMINWNSTYVSSSFVWVLVIWSDKMLLLGQDTARKMIVHKVW